MMEVLRLDGNAFLPVDVVEGLDSKIWTERFTDCGEFTFTSAAITKTRRALPTGTFVGIQGSDEIMMVESHSVKKDDNNVPTLEITGRTLLSFYENREIRSNLKEYSDGDHSLFQGNRYSAAEAISFLLWWNIVETIRHNDPDYPNFVVQGDPADRLPIYVSNQEYYSMVYDLWYTNHGDRLTQLLAWMSDNNLGVRTLRPPVYATLVSFDEFGKSSYQYGVRSGRPVLQVYSGTNRTGSDFQNDPVIFHREMDDLNSPSFLYTRKDVKNCAYVIGTKKRGTLVVFPEGASTTVSGWDRRVLYVDSTGISDDVSESDYYYSALRLGRTELAQHNAKFIFTAEASPDTKNVFNKDYFLGDTVRVVSDYDVDEAMQVTEYIRTEDDTGERAYPTLTQLI